MRLSGKIFFSTLIITVITFSAGGYVLISSLFQSAMAREIEAATEESKMLRFYLEASAAYRFDGEAGSIKESIESVVSHYGNKNLNIRILDEHYDLVYGVGGSWPQTELLAGYDRAYRAYALVLFEGNYYIQTLCALNYQGSAMYLESLRNINQIFIDRQDQFRTYRQLMLLLVFLNGILIFMVSHWIARPIRQLSKTTRNIASGDYSQRVGTRSKDELGMLAEDFNAMADNLEKKIYDLEEAAIRQEDFVGSFAHELKTPLTSIIGYADMLRSKKMPEESAMIAADYIFTEGKRLESLSLKLLELIVLKSKNFDMRPVSMGLLFKNIEALLYPVIDSQYIKLTVNAEDVKLMAEPDLLKTLLLNLLDNGRKAIKRKGKIIVNGTREADYYLITIEDTGKGIPEGELSRVTEAFYMVDKSRSRAKGGAGLGLAICSEIVALHKGKMVFESLEGLGTKVYLYLWGIVDESHL